MTDSDKHSNLAPYEINHSLKILLAKTESLFILIYEKSHHSINPLNCNKKTERKLVKKSKNILKNK